MTYPPPDLTGAAWLAETGVARVFALLTDGGEEARIVGGAVRDALLGRRVTDIDFATTVPPKEVMARAAEAGVKAVPTGLDHGTVTLVVRGRAFEVTTLREDVDTDGRHAQVAFGRDWTADARRRDFTMNALSVDAAGRVHDPLGGYDDLLAGKVRFIGYPARRIAEDRLRILRLFRFHAELGGEPIPAADLSAAIAARHDVRALSAERIGGEMRRTLKAARAVETAMLMQDTGILAVVLGGVGYVDTLRRAVAFEAAVGATPSAHLRLAALAVRVDEDVRRLTARLRLANAEADAMLAASAAARCLRATPRERDARRVLYRLGATAFRDGTVLAFAWHGPDLPDEAWRGLYALPANDPVPSFPLTGHDVTALGVAPGPAVGRVLAALEDWWVGEDFRPDRSALVKRLRSMADTAR